MTSEFGRGFVVNLMLLAKHFGLPPERAFYGASDHLDDLILPEEFRGTEIEVLAERLRKRSDWRVEEMPFTHDLQHVAVKETADMIETALP